MGITARDVLTLHSHMPQAAREIRGPKAVVNFPLNDEEMAHWDEEGLLGSSPGGSRGHSLGRSPAAVLGMHHSTLDNVVDMFVKVGIRASGLSFQA